MIRSMSLCGTLLLAGCNSSDTPSGPANGGSTSNGGAGGTQGDPQPGDAASAGQAPAPPIDAAPPALTCGEPIQNDSAGNDCHGTAPPALSLTPIVNAGDLFAPMMLASPPGDASRLFVITRGGTVRIVKDGVLLPDPFLDLTGVTTNNSGEAEHGLLGLAFDPGFAANRKIWLHYNVDANPIDSVTASVLASEDNSDLADPASLTPLFVENQPATNHNGGMVAFGRDGCLYVGFGDGGGGGDPFATGQNTDEPMASLLRIDAQTGNAAPGNPGYGDARIWNYGLRNPWRFSFDRLTGDLYVGDVGQGLWEEIDVEPAGTGDFNYGWNRLEGTHPFAGDDPTGLRMPIKEYDHDTGQSVTGGYVYRGTAIPGMVGRYLYADYSQSRYWVLTYAGENADGQPEICDDYEVTTDLGAARNPTAFAEDLAGELYVLTLGGAIYRIDPT